MGVLGSSGLGYCQVAVAELLGCGPPALTLGLHTLRLIPSCLELCLHVWFPW